MQSNAQADVNLCWMHMSEGTFSDNSAQMIYLKSEYMYSIIAKSYVIAANRNIVDSRYLEVQGLSEILRDIHT